MSRFRGIAPSLRRRGLALTAALAAVSALPAPGPAQTPTPSEPPAQNDPAPELDLDPRQLPRAEAARWSAWTPEAAPPKALHPSLGSAGRALRERDIPGALRALFEALELDPDYPPALHQCGALFFRLQRYGDAVVCFERYLDVCPERVGETRGLAHGLYSLGRYEQALAHYRRVVAASPKDVEALRGCALSHMRLGEMEPALELLERALQLNPEHVEVALWKARILYDDERIEEAHEAALRARELDAYRPQVWFLLGQILFELDRPEESAEARARFEELDRVVQEVRILEHRLLYDPGELAIHARLIELHRSNGDVRRTRSALARLVERQPRSVELRVHALDVLQGMGDAEGALVAARSLETACGDQPAAWQRLERFYALRGEREKQVECGERYLRLSGARAEGQR